MEIERTLAAIRAVIDARPDEFEASAERERVLNQVMEEIKQTSH